MEENLFIELGIDQLLTPDDRRAADRVDDEKGRGIQAVKGPREVTVAGDVRSFLLARYSPRDRRCKYPGPNSLFKIDDRGESDRWNWQISLAAPDSTDGLLYLHFVDIPSTTAMEEVVRSNDGTVNTMHERASFVVPLLPPYRTRLRTVARAVCTAAASASQRKWLRARLKKSLDLLAETLEELRGTLAPICELGRR